MSEQVANHEPLEQASLLRDVLLDTHFKPGRALPKEVSSIDLGVFTDEARSLANECFLDGGNVNYLKPVYVTGSKKVRIPIATFKGHDRYIPVLVRTTTLSKEVSVSRESDGMYFAMSMSSQANTDNPFTLSGTALLLAEDTDALGLSAYLVAGRTKNMLVFRGTETPQLSKNECEAKQNLWRSQITERMHLLINPGMSQETIIRLQTTLERILFRQICQKYDLQFFEGSSDQDIVKRVDFQA